jgi:hypothetical protein
MSLYSFNLDKFTITDTRSAHTDTDYASLTVWVSTNRDRVQTITSQNLGNLNNGTFNINLSCAGVAVYPDSPVLFNYLIVNSGSSNAQAVGSILEEIGTDLALNHNLNEPPGVSALDYVAGNYANYLNKIIKPGSCDGLVAAGQNTFTYQQFISYIGHPISTPHQGTKAPGNCNSRPSNYLTQWSVEQVAAVPPLTDHLLGTPIAQGTALQLLKAASLLPVYAKGSSLDSKATVNNQSPPAGQYRPINSPVTLTTTLNR